jgi:hypothetical protein
LTVFDHLAASKDIENLRERVEQERIQQLADREAISKEKAALRNEWDAMALERTTAVDANSKVQHEMQQIRTLAEELEGRAREVATLKEESERAMQEAAVLVEAARRAQEEAAAECQSCQDKEAGLAEAKRQLEKDAAETANARYRSPFSVFLLSCIYLAELAF